MVLCLGGKDVIIDVFLCDSLDVKQQVNLYSLNYGLSIYLS